MDGLGTELGAIDSSAVKHAETCSICTVEGTLCRKRVYTSCASTRSCTMWSNGLGFAKPLGSCKDGFECRKNLPQMLTAAIRATTTEMLEMRTLICDMLQD